MSNLAADKVLRVNCPGWGVSSTLPLGEAKPLAMYDVIVINPTSIIHLFEPKSDSAKQIEKLMADDASVLKLDSDSTLESISAELELREHELRQFLSKGGLLIYFLAPPFTVSGASLTMDNYLWLYECMPDKLDGKARTMAPSKGKDFSLSARGKQHAFSAYLQQLGLESNTSIKKDNLGEGYKILAESNDKIVAATKSTGPKRGQVVFLPAPYDTRHDDVLKDCILKWHDSHTGPDAEKPEPEYDESPAKSEKAAGKGGDEPDVEGRALLDDLFAGDDSDSKKNVAFEAPAASSGGSDFDSLDSLFSSPKSEAAPKAESKSDSKLFDDDAASKKSDSSDADKLFEEPAAAPEKKKASTLDWPELDDDVPPFAKEREEEKKRDEEKKRQKARDEEQAREKEEREREKARDDDEKSRNAEKAREEEKSKEREREEREREKARDEERDRERKEKEREEEKDRERDKAREEERALEREKEEKEREREREKAREEDREREKEKERDAERERERERMREEDRKADRDKEDRDAEKSREQDKAREKAREMQKELERLRDEEQERQRKRDEERERDMARSSNGSDANYPEAKDLMSRMEQEISSPGVPDWCQKVSFSELKQLHSELGDLNEQVRKAKQKINDVEDRIRNLGEVKDALLSLSGVRLTQACCKVFEALGWTVKISESSAGEVWLSDGDKTQAIVRIVYAAEQPNRSELAELAESVITYWGKYDVEPKGILIASTFAEKAPKDRTEEDFPGSMGEFAKRKNLCLFTCMQLLTIYRDVAVKSADVRKIRENLLTTSGILPGFKLDTVDASAQAEAAAT